MKKELLLRYIKGDTTKHEEDEILEWVAGSKSNEKYFVMLNNLWISQNISHEEASVEEVEEILKITTNKSLKNRLVKSFKTLSLYAAAALVLVSFSLGFLLNNSLYFKAKQEYVPVRLATLTTENKHEIYTEKGVKARIKLPDGSSVWLNSDSKIIYPDKFEADIREVEFSGEAYFEVNRDSLRPLIIKTNKNFKVEVLGTKFNLKSYDNDNEARTTLYSGSLNIIYNPNNKGAKSSREIVTTLKPTESFIIREKQAPLHIKSSDQKMQNAWKDGKIIFESTPLLEVIKVLERWHGTEFIVKDPSVYKFDITAKFRSESIVQIMEMLKYCALIDYSIDSNKVILTHRKI